MATLSEIYNWFMTGKKPSQAQFWASWGSFWNKGESIPQSAISNLTTVLNAKAETSQLANKVDKVEGKSLLSDEEIERLLTLENQDLSVIQNLVVTDGVLSGFENVLIIREGVTSISAKAFPTGNGKLFISRVFFNEGLLTIGNEAFTTQRLKVSSFPSTLISIGTGAFNNIEETSVTLPGNCTYYQNSFKWGVVITGGILII